MNPFLRDYMNDINPFINRNFYCIGLSYKKADEEVRGHFSLAEDQLEQLLKEASDNNIEELVAISTCNRTEIYGFAKHPYELIKLLCTYTKGTLESFEKVAYIHKNKAAINHFFKVGSGLDSQILGDFEIIKQVKNSLKLSRKYNLTGTFLNRLANAVIQTSKRIKNETRLSSGATSVSFAAVKYILQHTVDISNKAILLFGTGKIGRDTCENLIKHSGNKYLKLINRTKDKAEKIAGKFNLSVADYSNLKAEIQQTDILVVATGAPEPTVTKALLSSYRPLLILDLSIPKNVSDDVLELPQVQLVHLDELSEITSSTLSQREAEVPLATAILEEVKSDFLKWLENRRYAPTISALKEKLNTIKQEEIDYQRKKMSNFNEAQATALTDRIVQKITKHFANHLMEDNSSDESVELITKVFQLDTVAHG